MANTALETPLTDLKAQTITDDEFKRESAKAKSSAKAPPRKAPLPPWKDGVIAAFMTGLYNAAGDLILPFNQPYGMALKAIAENCGQAWEDCAKDNPSLRRWIYSLMNASKLSKLLMAHMPLMIVALHQHGPLRQATDDIAENVANGRYGSPSDLAA